MASPSTKPEVVLTLQAVGTWARQHKILAALAGLFLIGLIGSMLPGESAATGADQSPHRTVASSTPSDTPSASSKATSATPTPAPDPVADFEDDLKDVLGDVNRDDVKRLSAFDYDKRTKVLSIKFAINDNFSEGMIKDGAKMDVTDILEAVQKSDISIKTVNVEATFSMVDKLGNASEDTVVRATYSGSLIKKIDFDNFIFEDVYDITDDIFVHPALRD